MSIKIERKNDITIFIITGRLVFSKLMSVQKAFYEGKPTKHVIFDTSKGDLNDISLEQVIMASDYVKHNFHKRPAGAKSALVVKGIVDFGMMNIFQIWNEIKDTGVNSEIFYKFEDAYQWIYENGEQ